MAGWDVKAEGFADLSEKLFSLASGEEADRIQRAALRAAGNVIKDALIPATPTRKTTVYGKSLPAGALKAAVRTRIKLPKDGEPASATVDFGKLTYIAHIVDVGHMDAMNGGRTHTPAYPFISAVEDSSLESAADAYLTTMQAEIDKVINK